MKRMYCYALLFLGTAFLCLVLIYGLTRYRIRQEEPIPNTILETETVRDMEGREAVNQSGGSSGSKNDTGRARRRNTFWYLRQDFYWYSAAIKALSVCIPIFRSLIFRKGRERG